MVAHLVVMMYCVSARYIFTLPKVIQSNLTQGHSKLQILMNECLLLEETMCSLGMSHI